MVAEEQLKTASAMLEGWQDYLDRNWLNDNGEDLFSPELRVKRFLDSVGYYLLYGRTDGIVTAYKEAANRAREIPVSSCPGEVSNIMYAGNGNVDDEDEKQSFRTMTEILDERAPKLHKRRRSSACARRCRTFETKTTARRFCGSRSIPTGTFHMEDVR